MRIAVTIGATDYPGTESRSCVLVPIPCPTCGAKHAVLDGHGVIRALAGEEHLVTAQREMRAQFGPCTVAPPPPELEGCQVRLVAWTSIHNGWEGQAQCIRCRTQIGEMRVWADTIFGIEEDRTVLQGRSRVYGCDDEQHTAKCPACSETFHYLARDTYNLETFPPKPMVVCPKCGTHQPAKVR